MTTSRRLALGVGHGAATEVQEVNVRQRVAPAGAFSYWGRRSWANRIGAVVRFCRQKRSLSLAGTCVPRLGLAPRPIAGAGGGAGRGAAATVARAISRAVGEGGARPIAT
jgi:hypothetical protein